MMLIIKLLCLLPATSVALSMKEIYNVPKSGWTSPDWNWGYGVGTGHDCAAICRDRYHNQAARTELVSNLIEGINEPENFEEVKLTLALAWQAGRWNGSDGGEGGYGDVLQAMAKARRYEQGDEEECASNLVHDMMVRFSLLDPPKDKLDTMESLSNMEGVSAQRPCCGLVLEAMGFVEFSFQGRPR